MHLKAYTTFVCLFLEQNLLSQPKQLCLAYHLPEDSIPRNTASPVAPHDKDAKHAGGIRKAPATLSVVCEARPL